MKKTKLLGGGTILALVMAILLVGCFTSSKIKVNYIVRVTYINGSIDTLTGECNARIYDKNLVNIDISSRFRDEPCLLLLDGEDWVAPLSTIACGVRSFKVLSLKTSNL